MRTLLKGLIGLFLTVILLVAISLTAVIMFVDPNDYKQDLITLVKDQTGRDLTLQKPINLSLFPWLGIETGGVILGNAPGFGETPFAQIERLGLKLKLIPLLSREIEVDTLLLDGLQVNLMRNAQGQTNWADMAGQATPAKTPAAETQTTPANLSIQQIDIQNANLSWHDQTNGQRYQLQQFNLTTEGLAAGSRAPLQASMNLSSQQPAMALQLKLQTELGIGTDYQRYTLDNLMLTLAAKGETLPKDGIQLTLGAGINIDLTQQQLSIKDLQLDGPEIGLQGQLNVTEWAAQPKIQGKLKLAQTNLKALLAKFGSPLQTQNPQALTSVTADLTLEHVNNILQLRPIQLKLDKTTLQGQIQVKLASDIPAIQANLQLDKLNLDDYLPPATTETPPATSTAGTANPFQALQGFNLTADLRINQLQANKAKLNDIQLKLDNQQGLLRLKPIQATLYSGQFNGEVTMDARRQPIKIQAKKQLTGIQIGPLLHDVVGQDQLIGQGDLQLDVRLQGLTESAIRSSLQGTASFQFLDGAYQGVNLAELIQGAAGLFGLNLGTPNGTSAKRTDFAMLKGSLQIQKGVVRNRDLQLKSPLLRITGEGKVDLAADRVDYVLTTKLVKSLSGQGGKTASQLKGIPIPVRISGPLANLSYKPDLSGLVKARLQQQLKKEKTKVIDDVKDRVKQKAAELLGSPGGLDDAIQGLKGLFDR